MRDETYGAADTRDVVQDFLSRPVKIADITWQIGVGQSFVLNPWQLFFEDPRVLARIANFKNLSCDMKIKLLVNGNPFYHGLTIAAYQPLPGNDNRTNLESDDAAMIQLSQMPHVYLNPTSSTGGDLVLPFFHPRNALSIVEKEWRTMGALHVRTVAPLKHANGGTQAISISIFAMAINVNISSPTAVSPIEDQAGDEYGMVSGPAHSLARKSGYLSDAPMIGPYARATSMLASGVGSMAQLFGYSKPREVAEASSIKPRLAGNLAVTNTGDNISGLGVDAKKEITIDPRVVGLPGKDEMALVELAKRESYVTTFSWDPTNIADQHLFSTHVTPMQGDVNLLDTYLTPAAWVALPFRYWKGSVNFRFSILSSKYHKGRLRFVWDPYLNKSENNAVYNANYSTIVDISETTEVSLRIGWGADTSYLMHSGASTLPSFSTDEFLVHNAFANGTLSVYVVNELTTPSASADPIDIAIFTSMCDDFEVACPDSSLFSGAGLIRTTPLPIDFQPQPSDPPEPVTPPPVVPPDTSPTGDELAFFESAAPIGTRGRIFGPGPLGSSSAWVPGQGVSWTGTNGGFKLAFDAKTGSTLRLGLAFQPPLTVSDLPWNPETYDIKIKFQMFEGAVGNEVTKTVRNVPGNQPVTVFDIPLPASKGWGDVVMTFPVSGNWNLTVMDIPPTVGSYQWVRSGVQTETGDSTAVITNVISPAPTSLDGISAALTPSAYIEWPMYVPITGQVDTVFYAGVRGTAGNPFRACGVLDDGSVTSKGIAFPIQFGVTDEVLGVLPLHVPPIPAGRTLVGLRIFSEYGNYTIEVYSLSYFALNPVTIEDESGEEVDTSAQPVVDTLTDSMGPMCVDAKANAIHFGESITSWRQMLKRYISDQEFLNETGNFSQLLTDVNVQSDLSLPVGALHPMDYVRSAYVGYRGSVRIKVLLTPTTSADVVGSAVISRLPRSDLLQGLTYRPQSIKWDGSVWEPISLTKTVDAEIPYYSNLRFFPARLGADVQAISLQDTYLGRERLHYSLDVRTTSPHRLEVVKAAGEDFSLHFFLCTPILRLV